MEDKSDVQAAQELRKEIGADDEPETGAPEDVQSTGTIHFTLFKLQLFFF